MSWAQKILNFLEQISAPLLVALIAFIAQQLRSRYFKPPLVLVHEAGPIGSTQRNYHIKVISTTKTITITHIWVQESKDSKPIHVLNERTPLPKKLEPTDIYETWIAKDKIKDHNRIYKNFRVQLSTNQILKSKKNKHLPSEGMIGGIVDPDTRITHGSDLFSS